MRKICFLFLIVLTFACSDQKDDPSCSSDLSNIQLSSNVVYTGELITFSPASLCPSEQLEVFVDDQKISVTPGDNGAVSFTFPSISETTATVKVKAGKTEVSVGSVQVVKATGTWKEVASFPGAGRTSMVDLATNTDGYLYGGIHYEGTVYTSNNDLYKYNVSGNVWSKVATDDLFNTTQGTLVNDDLFLGSKIFSLSQNKFSSMSYLPGKVGSILWETKLFTLNGTVYAISDRDQNTLELQRYDQASDKWSMIKELPFTDNGTANFFYFNFITQYNGVAYIGISFLNRSGVELWTFNSSSNSLSKIGSVVNEAPVSIGYLKHFFTLNGLGYFVENGESSMDNDGKVSIIKPGSYFYVYNFASNDWRKVSVEFPESMYGANSLNVGNRGFAGMSASAGTTGFIYSQKFWEFVPE
jgi:N-acetylneuraminic acid mutarotase